MIHRIKSYFFFPPFLYAHYSNCSVVSISQSSYSYSHHFIFFFSFFTKYGGVLVVLGASHCKCLGSRGLHSVVNIVEILAFGSSLLLMKRWEGKKTSPVEDHPVDFTLSVQDGDTGGTLVDQGFVSLMPLFCSSTLRARVSVVLEILLSIWSLFCRGRTCVIAVTLGAGLVFCTSWVLLENMGSQEKRKQECIAE